MSTSVAPAREIASRVALSPARCAKRLSRAWRRWWLRCRERDRCDRAGAAAWDLRAAVDVDLGEVEVLRRALDRRGHGRERDRPRVREVELRRARRRDVGDQVRAEAAGEEVGIGAGERVGAGRDAAGEHALAGDELEEEVV